jgi:peptidyl-dipeptidase Dcp
MNEDNPLSVLLDEHAPLPFDRVKADHFSPAVRKGLEQARSAIDAITGNPEPPTFENTAAALEAADEGVDRISSVFYHLLHVQSSEDLQQLARELPPLLSGFHNDVMMNAALFERLRQVEADNKDLSPEQQQMLEDLMSAFRRNGASLSEDGQKRLREIDQELSTCAPQFAEHVLKATQSHACWIQDPDVVAPLPESAKQVAKEAAAKEGRPQEWKFTLDAPSFLAFMTYIEEEDLRKDMWMAYTTRCVEGEFENQSLIRSILRLRHARAQLLGYQDHTHYTLEQRMVKDRQTLNSFYDRLTPVVMPAARADLNQLSQFKAESGTDSVVHPWDVAFLTEKLRQQKFDFRQEDVRPWFSYEDTVEMLFHLTGILFDLSFEKRDDLPLYDDQVTTYRVTGRSDGREVGNLLLDPFPRTSKRPGAWMNPLLAQGLWSGEVRRPLVAIVANFSPPSASAPSLLTMDEARTLFHEFGHALHELLSTCTYRSVSGTRVRWDFVELPSQLLENWLLEPEFLRAFPKHVETGVPLPEDMIAKIQKSRTFMKGYQSARQLAFGKLDLAWYTTPPDRIGDDLLAFEDQAVEEVRLFPPQPGSALSPSFQHIFSGGYAAGYYSYKWAEALEADVFETFRENGLFDPDTAKRLESTLLSQGGSRPPQDLFRAFKGRDPDPDALLRRDGLLEG